MEEEIKRDLRACCNSLKPPYDEVARSYYLEEQSPREIADRLGQNVKTIQTQIYRARQMLQKLYGKEEMT